MSEDLIKRSDAIEAITNHCENECYYRVDSWCPQCQREEFQDAIKAIPSVDIPHTDDWEKYSERLWKNAYERGKADRPQGYWTKTDVATYRCSECGKIQIADDVNELNFCCCCGSRNKMRRLKGADDESRGACEKPE